MVSSCPYAAGSGAPQHFCVASRSTPRHALRREWRAGVVPLHRKLNRAVLVPASASWAREERISSALIQFRVFHSTDETRPLVPRLQRYVHLLPRGFCAASVRLLACCLRKVGIISRWLTLDSNLNRCTNGAFIILGDVDGPYGACLFCTTNTRSPLRRCLHALSGLVSPLAPTTYPLAQSVELYNLQQIPEKFGCVRVQPYV